MIGRTLALDVVIGRSERAAIWIPSLTVYADGYELDVEIRHRLDDRELDHPVLHPHHSRRRELDAGFVRFGIELADGRKATNLGSLRPLSPPGDPESPPKEPVLSPSRGGGGGGGRWHHGFWAWPLPPPGSLAFVCEWPAGGIAETRTVIDAEPVRAAAADAVELWPDDGEGRHPSGGGGTWAVTAMRARGDARPTGEPIELEVDSERSTHLIDITDEVARAVRGKTGAAVVVFVPHTTAGVVLQAAGPGATKVAVDLESALERVVDPTWPWQHVHEGDRNPWAHVRAALTANSVTIPLENGELALGELQRVFLCELDGPRRRRVRLRVV